MTTAHPSWCAHGHRCNLGEHRADPLTVPIPGAGSVVLTRVRDTAGREYAELWMRFNLPPDEATARRRLVLLLNRMTTLLTNARTRKGRAA